MLYTTGTLMQRWVIHMTDTKENMFKIDDKHLLQMRYDSPNKVELIHKVQQTKFNKIMKPEILLIHYAVTDSLDALVASQLHTKFFAHFCIDGVNGRYQVTQIIPCNIAGSHAGESIYKGRSGCNAFSVGIEIANPGPLVKQPDGSLKTTYGKKWPMSDAIEAKHKSGKAPKEWTHWSKYSTEEINIVADIGRALLEKYQIKDVVGHDDVSPGRKSDPGPAFPMQAVHDDILNLD